MDTVTAPAATLPAATGLDLAALAAANLTPVLGSYFERSWARGEGHHLYDTDGKAYLDFANGIAVSVLGHRHPAVTAAIHAQVDKMIVPCGAMGYAESTVRHAKLLAEFLPEPLDSIFFMNSGSEAIEGALKLARRVTGRPGIIAFRGAFHGRTIAAASITSSNINYRRGYEPLLPGVYLSLYPSVYRDCGGDEERAVDVSFRHLRDLLHTCLPPESVAAIILEPVQGEGGYIPAPPAFLQILRSVCDEHGILLVADEVQSGFGRTGKMFAVEHTRVEPDIMCLAKALGNGMPIAAMVAGHRVMGAFREGEHGTTYGGNAVACAAVVAVIVS